MRKQLDAIRYDAVRILCQESSEIVSRDNAGIGIRYCAPTREEFDNEDNELEVDKDEDDVVVDKDEDYGTF